MYLRFFNDIKTLVIKKFFFYVGYVTNYISSFSFTSKLQSVLSSFKIPVTIFSGDKNVTGHTRTPLKDPFSGYKDTIHIIP